MKGCITYHFHHPVLAQSDRFPLPLSKWFSVLIALFLAPFSTCDKLYIKDHSYWSLFLLSLGIIIICLFIAYTWVWLFYVYAYTSKSFYSRWYSKCPSNIDAFKGILSTIWTFNLCRFPGPSLWSLHLCLDCKIFHHGRSL